MSRKLLALGVLVAVASSQASAIHLGEGDLPYAQAMQHPLDKPVNDKYDGKAFFMNLGPTGIRARIDPDAPRAFKVMFVFQDAKSPARGKIEIGDMIVGANGRLFQNEHGFHRKKAGARGWQGPPYELALAIEDSQGAKGELQLIVWPGGDQRKQTVVKLQIEPKGRFSKTYPWNCERSDKLRQELCTFLINNGIKGRHHYQIQQLLALWAAGDKRAMPLIEAKARELMSKKADPDSSGMVTWNWGYSGIFLGEYYNMTRDKRVLPAIEALNECFATGMDWRAGGFSHRPFPFIQKRIANGGPKGYGAMAGPGGLSMLAQSTFKANGLPYAEEAYLRTHQAYLRTAGGNDRASIAYGFSPWTHAVIEVEDPTKGLSGKGIGHRCPTGMKNIGSFKILWPTKADPRWKPTDWVANEAATNLVYEKGGKQRLVIRNMPMNEPTGPYRTNPDGGGHVAPMGMGAAAHFIGNKGNDSWNWLGAHMASGAALSPKMIFDGHADATMHGFFSVVGAGFAQPDHLRSYLDYVKTLIILSETHDGQGLVEQPFGCQRNSTCSIARDRTAYTHVVILLLSLPRQQLLITGAESPVNTVPGGGSSTTSTRVVEQPVGPMSEIEDEDFTVVFCTRQAEQVNKGRDPYLETLRQLDAFTEEPGERAAEAEAFAERLRGWIAEQTKQLLADSEDKPVATMGQINQFLLLVDGLEEHKTLAKRVAEIRSMRGAAQLNTAYRTVDRIDRAVERNPSEGAMEMASRGKQRVAEQVKALLERGGLDETVKAEAEALLEELGSE